MRAMVLVLLAATGCFSQLTSQSDITCDSLENCPVGYLCDPVARVCREAGEVPTCARDTDCPLAQICISGACGPGCVRDGDCGLDVACIEGACVDDGRCNTSATCPFGQSCSAAGRCEFPAGGGQVCQPCYEARLCLSDTDCPGTSCVRPDLERYGRCETCGGGLCRFSDTSEPGCSDDAQCGGGRICYRGPCTADPQCAASGWGTCGAYLARGAQAPAEGVGSCTLGTCVRAECSFRCDATAEIDTCGRGYACTRFITIPVTDTCTTDADCGANSQCRRVNESDAQRYCSCSADSECPSDTRCSDGACVASEECAPLLGLTCQELRP